MSLPGQNTQKKKRIIQNSQYIGMAYQIFGLLAFTIFFGLKADAHYGNDKQYITAVASVIILLLYFYKLYITLNKKK